MGNGWVLRDGQQSDCLQAEARSQVVAKGGGREASAYLTDSGQLVLQVLDGTVLRLQNILRTEEEVNLRQVF